MPWRKGTIEPELEDTKCGFRPGRSATDQIFTLQQIFEKSWEFAKYVHVCFVDLEKAYDWVPRGKLRVVLPDYGVGYRTLLTAKSLYSFSEVCVRAGGVESQPFNVGVRLQQGCVLSPLLFMV